jgi:hypothetical protein
VDVALELAKDEQREKAGSRSVAAVDAEGKMTVVEVVLLTRRLAVREEVRRGGMTRGRVGERWMVDGEMPKSLSASSAGCKIRESRSQRLWNT